MAETPTVRSRLSPSRWINARRKTWQFATTTRWSFLAAIVGLIVGLCSIALDLSTQAVATFSLHWITGYAADRADGEPDVFAGLLETIEPAGSGAMQGFSPWLIVLVVTTGGLLSGILVYRVCPEASGPGTDAAVDSFHKGKGVVRGRVVWAKTIASAITLGTGGSGGREGPIAHIGAAVGSFLARKVNLSARDRRILLAAGMGAGVGAMFRAPLAGAIFAGEILYSDADMEADVIVPSAIASVVGYSVYSQSLPMEIRYQPLFGVQLPQAFGSPIDLLPYVLLAVLLGILAASYVRLFHFSQNRFATLPVPIELRPAIGGLFAGLIGVGLFFAADQFTGDVRAAQQLLSVLGTGYGMLQSAVTNVSEISIGILAAVCLGKMLTTSLSIGSGGSGGVFGPSMVVGGCAGAAFGKAVQSIFPDLVPHPEAFAIVGMAGFFAGVARAPISTIIIIRELTGDFGLLVPTLLVSTLTFLLSGRIQLYKKQVPTRMDSPAHRGDFIVDVLEGLHVEDVYLRNRKITLINEAATLDDIVHRIAKTHQHYFPVVDSDENMIGIFSDDDVRAYLYDETLWRLANAGDVMTVDFVRVKPSDDLNTALQKFTALNLDELPVMDDQQPTKLLGFLRRRETIAAYNRRIIQHRREIEAEQ